MPLLDRTALTSLKGHPVTSSHGAKIGKIVDVYETGDGVGTFVTVSTGLFGGAASFVPVNEATMVDGTVVVPYTEDVIRDAPRVEDDQQLTPAEEDRLYTHYRVAPIEEAVTAVPVAEDSMTRSEERMAVGTVTRESGRARLRKHVVTETVSRTVPVTHDTVSVTRESIAAGDRPAAPADAKLSAEVYEVVLTEEVAISAKETVPVERVRMRTAQVTEQATVTENLGHEVIEVEKPG